MEINKNGILKDEKKRIADLILSRVSAAPTTKLFKGSKFSLNSSSNAQVDYFT
jgi:hypothetical protein